MQKVQTGPAWWATVCATFTSPPETVLVRARAPRAVDQAALGQSRCDSTTSRATSAIASVAATPIVASCHGCSCA